MANDKAPAAAAAEPTYTREALAASKKYRAQCDAIMVALADGKEYTAAEAEAAINEVLKRKVVEKVNE